MNDIHKRAAVTTPERRRSLIRQLIAAGHDPKKAALTLDVAFQAVDASVEAFHRTLMLLGDNAGSYMQASMLAGQLAATEYRHKSEGSLIAAQALAKSMGGTVQKFSMSEDN